MRQIKTITLLVLLLVISACEDILEVPDISDQTITILAPLDGSRINGNSINFNWNMLLDAENYRVQIATPSFENANQILVDSLFTKDTLGFVGNRIQLSLLNGNYQWRVKALNSGYETPFARSGFTVDGDADADIIAPNTPALGSPDDMTTQDETAIQFTWSRENISGSAERDSIYIFTDNTLQTLELKGLGANKTFEATLITNTYYWIVKAFDDAGNESVASAAFQLTIN